MSGQVALRKRDLLQENLKVKGIWGGEKTVKWNKWGIAVPRRAAGVVTTQRWDTHYSRESFFIGCYQLTVHRRWMDDNYADENLTYAYWQEWSTPQKSLHCYFFSRFFKIAAISIRHVKTNMFQKHLLLFFLRVLWNIWKRGIKRKGTKFMPFVLIPQNRCRLVAGQCIWTLWTMTGNNQGAQLTV